MTVGFRFTTADLEKLPQIDGVRYEIIDGELYVSHQPQFGHQYAADEVHFALRDWSKRTGAGVPMATPGLVFPVGDDNLVPDVVWFRRDRLAGSLDDNQHFRIAPDLVVEVLSPGPANELRDREIKLELYSRRGVQEYWIVDWQSHQVLVHRRDGGELRPV
jgi:Uma2 family endonuclease